MFRCGCGQYNYVPSDWIAHFRYRGFRAGLRNLLKTRVEIWPKGSPNE